MDLPWKYEYFNCRMNHMCAASSITMVMSIPVATTNYSNLSRHLWFIIIIILKSLNIVQNTNNKLKNEIPNANKNVVIDTQK